MILSIPRSIAAPVGQSLSPHPRARVCIDVEAKTGRGNRAVAALDRAAAAMYKVRSCIGR